MTTPRDDIAGLIERLLAEIGEPVIYRNDAVLREAATQLAALSAETAELQAALDRVVRVDNSLAKQLSKSISANAALSARVKELEAKPPLLDAQSLPRVDALIKTLEARALRAEQERDEAVKHLRDIIDGWDWWKVDTCDRCSSVPADAIDAARRLASGPEKEKKE